MFKLYKVEKQLLLPLLVIIPTVIFIFASVISIHHYKTSIKQHEELQSSLNETALGLAEGLYENYDYVKLIELQKRLAKYSFIMFINFYDEKMKPIGDNTKIPMDHDMNMSHYKTPIKIEEQIFGHMEIGYDKSKLIKNLISELIQYFVMLIILFTLILISMAKVVKGSVTKPLNMFLSSVAEVESGNWGIKNIIKRKDNEITDAHEKFVKLSNQLNETTINREFMQKIFESMLDFIIIADEDLKIIFFNSMTSKKLGYDKKELKGLEIKQLMEEKDLPLLQFDSFFANEMSLTTKDGDKIQCLSTITELLDSSGKPKKLIVAKDISELLESRSQREEIQKQLMMSSKLASLGELASGVGHEINNPLTVVIGYMRLLKMKVFNNITGKEKKFLAPIIPAIEDSLERIQDIVKGLRFYSHMDAESVANINMAEVLKNIKLLMGKIYEKTDIALSVDISNKELMFSGNLHKTQQIITNILSNSKDAISEIENPNIEIKAYLDDDNVNLEISDNGHGIPEDKKEQIFDAFFTTKEAGKGTGLGLSLVHSFVTSMKGEISFVSEKGLGTAFHIKFPILKKNNN